MFLLTTGPHLYYVDPVNNVLKGQVPYTADIAPEVKNFRTFFLHTVNELNSLLNFICQDYLLIKKN